jgi:Tfp pilus assembly protein FimT
MPSHRPQHPDAQRVRQVDKAQRGTTLVELLIGLALLTVLTGLAVPGISSLLRAYNLRSAADDFLYGVNLARSQAVSNHRAYGIVLTGLTPTSPLKFKVVQGLGTQCSSIVGGLVVYSADYSPGNLLNDPPVRIRAFAPGDLSNAGADLCFKTDGRVLRADTAVPFSPPSGSKFEAGDVYLELIRLSDDGSEIGTAIQVQVGYNGTARITFGRPLNQLQGGGAP